MVFERVTSVLTVFREKETVGGVVSVWCRDMSRADHYFQSVVTTIEESRREVRSPGHLPHTQPLRLELPVRLERSVWYELEVVFFPSDVTNHYSGYPVTTCGAEVWTCWGQGGGLQHTHRHTIFRSILS